METSTVTTVALADGAESTAVSVATPPFSAMDSGSATSATVASSSRSVADTDGADRPA